MKKTLLIYFTVVAAIFLVNSCEDISINVPGVTMISGQDTVRFSQDTIRFPQDTSRLAFLSQWYVDTLRPPPDTVWKDTLIIFEDTLYADTLYRDTLYADTLKLPGEVDTVYNYSDRTLYATKIPDSEKHYYAIHKSLRNIGAQILADSLGSPTFRVVVKGSTNANSIRFAAKCIGYDTTMQAIDNRIGLTLEPDSTGSIEGETEPFTCHPPGGNATMDYWLTAHTDTAEIVHRDHIDVAHKRSIGN